MTSSSQQGSAEMPRPVTIAILEQAASGAPVQDFMRMVLLALRRESGCRRVVAELRHEQVGFWDARVDEAGFDFTPASKEADFTNATDYAFDLPVSLGGTKLGCLQFHDGSQLWDSEALHELSTVLAVTLSHKRTHVLLRERVKELTCFYGIAEATSRRERTLRQVFEEVIELLPPAWRYPESAFAQVCVDDITVETMGFEEVLARQRADIVVAGVSRGHVQVGYKDARPQVDEGPFLVEERKLIDNVARKIGLMVERRQTRAARESLEGQLRHADRLATVGQLAAGVAHELNEPLANVLGFAQLAQKSPNLPADVAQDLEKIVSASLHARAVIQKLLTFARQAPTQKLEELDLNQIVRDSLDFLQARCQKLGIEIDTRLAEPLPRLRADAGQMLQVVVNLAVNAVHAMPNGGRLTVTTELDSDFLHLIVEDTGEGMTPAVREQVFLPFFTTKDVGEGTGLGLSVVHGIVLGHRGSIQVNSEVGKGTRFDVRLPHEEQQP